MLIYSYKFTVNYNNTSKNEHNSMIINILVMNSISQPIYIVLKKTIIMLKHAVPKRKKNYNNAKTMDLSVTI